MTSTFYNKNHCDRCGYEWYPRGKNKSLRCPDCGSRSVLEEVEYEVTDLNVRRQGWKVCAAATIVFLISPIFGDGAAFKLQTAAAIGGFVGICMIQNKSDEIHYE